MTENSPTDGTARSRVLLLGDASARPEGLERALVRAGFAVDEGDRGVAGHPPGLALIIVRTADDTLRPLLETAAAPGGVPAPRIVLIAGDDPGAPARALAMGADEALPLPPNVNDLVARLAARIGRHPAPRPPEPAAQAGAQPEAAPGVRRPRAPVDELDSRVRGEFERARRYALSFSLVLIDIDQVEGYSDRLGREATDRVLADVGDVLRTGLRAPDFVSRYTGDEFAVLLPETSLNGARQSVTRVRERLVSHDFDGIPAEDRPRITAGIVTFPHPAAAQIDDLFALAEAALLRARHQTGERTATAEAAAT